MTTENKTNEKTSETGARASAGDDIADRQEAAFERAQERMFEMYARKMYDGEW